jgi:glycine/D-amino acid oxidase-like deaminating enzyme
MQTFDWIVVGNGLTGAAASYELARQGFSVMVIDQALQPANATYYSYGGIHYWAGTDATTRQLCAEGWARYHQLSEELGQDIELRELDLLLTVLPGQDPQALATQFEGFAMPPQLISTAQAQEMEPLLDGSAIAAAFTVRHGHVSPLALVAAYNQAFQRLGALASLLR